MSIDDFMVEEYPSDTSCQLNDSGIMEILEELRSDNGGNYKIGVLKKYKDNELLQKVLHYTYTPFKQYYLKQLPSWVGSMNESGSYISLEDGIKFLDTLANRDITGNNAREQLSFTIDHMTENDATVLLHIIDRDINCGISGKSVNKVWKELIPEIPYMRCEKLNEKTKKNITYPAIVQLKADGLFVNIVKHNKTVYCMTRNGTKFHITKINESLEMLKDVDDFVVTGEVVVYKDNKPLSRKESNGRANSYIKRETTRQSILEKQKKLMESGKGSSKTFDKLVKDITEKELEWKETEDNLVIEGWDCISYKHWTDGKSVTSYSTRFENYKQLASKYDFFDIIPTVTVNNFEDAQKQANEWMLEGFEGGVLKNLIGPWENKTSKNQIKLKAELDADLICVDYLEGDGDFKGGIGSLVCQTSCGQLVVNVGSGLTRFDRGLQRVDEDDMSKGIKFREDLTDLETYFNTTYKDKIIEIKYNEVIQSDSKDTWSLFLPIFLSVRDDKDTADTLERLQS